MLAIALGLAAIASSTTPSVKAASVAPTLVSGNPSCASLGYAFELKLGNADGTFNIGNGGTITIDVGATGTLNSFNSTIYINAVIMKGGPNANVYAYGNPGVFSDTNLVTPTNPNNGQLYGTSHISFCYNDPNPPAGQLTVTKTAELNYDRECEWDVEKEADVTSLELAGGESATINYTVTVTADCANGDPPGSGTVSGQIFVTNIGNLTVNGISVVDEVNGVAATVNCPATSLAPGGAMTCTYSATVAIGDGTNEVTASGTDTASNPTSDSDTVNYTDNGPANVILGCVYLSDTHPEAALSDEELCEEDQPAGGWVFNYSKTVTAAAVCEPFTVDNTADIRDEEGNLVDEDTVSIPVTCEEPPQWCSPGFWRNHLDLAEEAAAAGGFSLDDSYNDFFDPDLPGDPSLLDVLLNPQIYGGEAFNNVGDLLSDAHPDVNWEFGDSREGECPLGD